jgi:hypothetical protein
MKIKDILFGFCVLIGLVLAYIPQPFSTLNIYFKDLKVSMFNCQGGTD